MPCKQSLGGGEPSGNKGHSQIGDMTGRGSWQIGNADGKLHLNKGRRFLPPTGKWIKQKCTHNMGWHWRCAHDIPHKNWPVGVARSGGRTGKECPANPGGVKEHIKRERWSRTIGMSHRSE